MFSCYDCEYGKRVSLELLCECNHPEIKKLGLVKMDGDKVTKEDEIKIQFLMVEILELKVNTTQLTLPRFHFPFLYEPIWIEDCEGFKKC